MSDTSDDPLEFIPPFISPLTHDQHARIGRIALVWGQIDMVLDNLLERLIGITPQQRLTLLGERPIGAKLDMLKAHIKGIKDKNTRGYVQEFWDLANQTKTQRNKCFHGIWGFRCVRKNTVVPGASHFKSVGDPLRVTQLPALEKKLCRTARIGAKALIGMGVLVDAGASRLYHGLGPPPPWLEEWNAQRPLDDGHLDRRWKRGQLPYLAKQA